MIGSIQVKISASEASEYVPRNKCSVKTKHNFTRDKFMKKFKSG